MVSFLLFLQTKFFGFKASSREQHRQDLRCQKVSSNESRGDGEGGASYADMLCALVTLCVSMSVSRVEREHIDLVKGENIYHANCNDEEIGKIHV